MYESYNVSGLDNNESLLTIIIPVRVSKQNDYILERLNFIKLDSEIPEEITILVIDDGSEKAYSKKIEKNCSNNNFSYFRLDTHEQEFSFSRARNAGGVISNSKYIMFFDVDLMPYTGFFSDISKEISIQLRHGYENDFIVVGVLYLTEESTQEYLDTSDDLRKSLFLSYLLEFKEDIFIHDAPVSSVVLLSRSYFLKIGGCNESFSGWGLEDSEFAVRLVYDSKKFSLPRKFQQLITKDYSDQVDYVGWRSLYRLWGDITSNKGIYLFHAHHGVDDSFRNNDKKERNLAIYKDSVQRYLSEGQFLESLPNLFKEGKGGENYRPSGKEISLQSKLYDRYRYSLRSDKSHKDSFLAIKGLNQRLGIYFFYAISYLFIGDKMAKKLREDPHRFFQDSKNKFTILYGKFLRIIR